MHTCPRSQIIFSIFRKIDGQNIAKIASNSEEDKNVGISLCFIITMSLLVITNRDTSKIKN